MTTRPHQSSPTKHNYGFEQQMKNANWDQFPAWYRARCLITPVPQGVPAAMSEKFRVAA